jgi:hypothetical protein
VRVDDGSQISAVPIEDITDFYAARCRGGAPVRVEAHSIAEVAGGVCFCACRPRWRRDQRFHNGTSSGDGYVSETGVSHLVGRHS